MLSELGVQGEFASIAGRSERILVYIYGGRGIGA
jgi:hypothetical protein